MEEGKVSESSAVEEEGSAKEEIWCLKRVGKTSDWLRLVENMEVTLGRALNVTYQLLSLSCPLMISRQHCLFKQNDDGQWTVTDKKSLNGVWVNGERIAAEKAWPLSAGDSVRLGVPVEGTQMEFEYELVQDRLEAVEPFLRGAQPGVEDTVPPRAKQTKRRLEAEESDPAKLYRAKLYRCSAVDKSLGRPCPAGELPPPAAQSQAREAPGPSVAVARPEGRRPAPHAKPSAARASRRSDSPQTLRDSPRQQQQQQQQQHAGDEEEPSAEEPSAQPPIAQAELRSQQPGRLEEIRELQAQQSVLQARLRTQEEQQLEDVLHQEEMRMEVEKRQLQEVHLKKQLEDALQEQRKVIEELKCSRQGFEEILQAKDKELEMSKEEKEQARAQKEEVVIQMTDVLENELQCIICSELLIEAVTLSCAHSFCQYCIGAWRRRSAACPICRQDILSQARSLVLDNCIDRMVESLSTELKERRQALIAERKAVAAVSAVAVVLISDDDTSYSSSSSTLGEDSTISESGSIAISESDMSDFGSSDSGSLAALDSSLDTSGYDDI